MPINLRGTVGTHSLAPDARSVAINRGIGIVALGENLVPQKNLVVKFTLNPETTGSVIRFRRPVR
jgi:hypothetical protein